MTSSLSAASPRAGTPTGAAPRPQARAFRAVACAVALSSLGAFACQNSDAQVTSPVVLGITDQMTPFYQDAQNTIFQAQIPVPLPMRRATDDELKALGKATAPYPRAPFLSSTDVRIEIRWTLTNLDDKPHSIELLFDAWNEFVRYRPAIQQLDEENTRVDYSGNDQFHLLGPKQRLTGTLTPDDTRELEVDLATAMNILASAPPPDPNNPMASGAFDSAGLINRAMNVQNRSTDGDPLLTKYIPPVIAGLTGFDLGLRSREPLNVAVEITVDVVDLNGNHVLAPGTTEQPIGMPGTTISTH